MSSVPELKIRQAMDLALEHQRAGRLREAGAIFRRVLQADPDNADALHFLGVIAHRIGRPDLALDLLERSVQADPAKVGFQLNLGNLYLKLHRVDDATACYRAAIRHNPDYASAYAHLGNALYKLGRAAEGDAAIRRAWELRQKQGGLYPTSGERGAPADALPPLPEARPVPEAPPPPEPPELPRFTPAADQVQARATPVETPAEPMEARFAAPAVAEPAPVEPAPASQLPAAPEPEWAAPDGVADAAAAAVEAPPAGPVAETWAEPPALAPWEASENGFAEFEKSTWPAPPDEAVVSPQSPAAGMEFEAPAAPVPKGPPHLETAAAEPHWQEPPALAAAAELEAAALPDEPGYAGPSSWPPPLSAPSEPAAPACDFDAFCPTVEPRGRVRVFLHLEEAAHPPRFAAEPAGATALAEPLPDAASPSWAPSDETEPGFIPDVAEEIHAIAPVMEPGAAPEPPTAADAAPILDRLFLGDGLADDEAPGSGQFLEPDFAPVEPATPPEGAVADAGLWADWPEVLLPEFDDGPAFPALIAPPPDGPDTAEADEPSVAGRRAVMMNALVTPDESDPAEWDQMVLTDEGEEPSAEGGPPPCADALALEEPSVPDPDAVSLAPEATQPQALPDALPAEAPPADVPDVAVPDAPPIPEPAGPSALAAPRAEPSIPAEPSTFAEPPAASPGPNTSIEWAVPPGLLGSADSGPAPDLTRVATDRATIKQRLASGWFAADVPDPSAPRPPPGAPPRPAPPANALPPLPPDANLPGIFVKPPPPPGPRRAPSAEALRTRAAAMVARRRLDEAVGMLTRAIAIRPNFAEAYRDLGGALLRRGDMEAAIASLKRALELKPNFAEAWGSLGDAYQLEGKVVNAIRCYRRLLELAPGAAKVHSNLLLTLNYDAHLGAEQVFQEHLAWALRHAEPLTARAAPHANDRTPDRRLKIGYVSPDFRRHSVNYFIEPVLAAHDRTRFHVTCYSDVIRPDAVTKGLARLCDAFHPVRGLSDEKLAERIRADRIDVLVDLSGHTGNNRLCAFARRAAPVQVTWLGYPNTTGMSAMDCRLTDAWADPVGRAEPLHSERLVRMPHTFLCYRPPAESPDVSPPPCLTTGHVTFGCFNILAKVTSEVLAVWAKAMLAVPGSRLVLKGRGGALAHESRREFVRDTMVYHGVSADRLELLPKVKSYTAHLDLYRRLDIVLDPFPYNGTTTTCEALWMGLPVVALAGDRHVSRVGVSLLSNVGLADLITRTPEQYARVAAGLARSPRDLANLRSGLRQQMLRSPLTDAQRFTRALEERYREMWVKWCETGGKPAADQLTLPDA